ncbi:MAG: deoxyribodipyrimidine photolyase [Deinococcus-Thermus bacterium]|jgi:deoxyribodipyrimidine photo-lyase|nr:deoxyribodipyrimidine photolyase [Deinococcota bacterium]
MTDDRLQPLNDAPVDADGRYVLYWMQQSQRASFNPALAHAIERADALDLGVIVGFGLMDDYPEANERHYAFMLEGLAEVQQALHDRGIKMVCRRGAPDAVALDLARDAALVVCDRGYLRHQRAWRDRVAEEAGKAVVQVEGDVVVPVETVSDKVEYAARTIRPKLTRLWPDFLAPVADATPGKNSLPLDVTGDLDLRDPEAALADLTVDRSVGRVDRFTGGTAEARRRLEAFVADGMAGYAAARSDPAHPQSTNLSPYLHFGQISPVEIVRRAERARAEGGLEDDIDALLEELIVRRELSHNFVTFHPDYDRYANLPDWARTSLAEHSADDRPRRYSRDRLEAAATDDRYWNAAMGEMVKTGYMHNYMRMYWGKKILEWSATPEDAYATTLHLNNKYFLDGRDPNSYANVAWLFGRHDRPWQERAVFGKIRYMAASGLERKFDIDAYVRWVDGL